MPESDSCSVSQHAHTGRSSALAGKRRVHYSSHVRPDSDDEPSSSDDYEDSGTGQHNSGTTGQSRFWASRSPHALDAGRESRLVLRRPGGSYERQAPGGLSEMMASYAALQLHREVPGVMGRDRQSRILFVSLLENYCRTYDDDPLRNRRLFFAICRTLYSMGIIDKEYRDEMSSLRATYSDAFRQLVVRAQESLDMYEQHDIETGIRSLMSSVAEGSDSSDSSSNISDSLGQTGSYTGEWSISRSGVMPPEYQLSGYDSSDSKDAVSSANAGSRAAGHWPYSSRLSARTSGSSKPAATANGAHPLRRSSRSGSTVNTFETMMMDVQRSRYHDDFVQLRCLGKGGFGKVYEVRNKLDGRPYAVKHIKIRGEITAEKTLREIKTLANLDHPNIVRYYSSWIEVTRLRKRASGSRHDAHSTSPFMALYGMPHVSDEQSDSVFGASMADLSAGHVTVNSPSSPNGSISEIWQDDSGGNPFDSATGISIVSPGSSYDGGAFALEDSFDNGEAFVMAEVSIGHTNESYDQRRETENNIVFETSAGGGKCDGAAECNSSSSVGRAAAARSCPPAFDLVDSPEQSACGGDPALPSAGVHMPAPIPIGPHLACGSAGPRGGPQHRRQRSLHMADRAPEPAAAANANRRSMSVLDTLSGQPRSLPSQVLAGMDLAQPFASETTLFVQMQLCQTTLQEYLSHRNQRIASKQTQSSGSLASNEKDAGDGAEWCEMSEQELLIDPVMNVRLFRAIVEGVKYFHNRGVIHRDLKGANVFLDIVYADSGGNPISRGGSGVGRPGAALARRPQREGGAALGIANVHSDAWDAVDGGNLREAPVAGEGSTNGEHGRSRNVDWEAVFGSIIANRSVNAGRRAPSAGAKPAAASRPASASSHVCVEPDGGEQ
ncbi:hypothetical protein H4S01_002547, partial [Coemansia sp. RSA 2610]